VHILLKSNQSFDQSVLDIKAILENQVPSDRIKKLTAALRARVWEAKAMCLLIGKRLPTHDIVMRVAADFQRRLAGERDGPSTGGARLPRTAEENEEDVAMGKSEKQEYDFLEESDHGSEHDFAVRAQSSSMKSTRSRSLRQQREGSLVQRRATSGRVSPHPTMLDDGQSGGSQLAPSMILHHHVLDGHATALRRLNDGNLNSVDRCRQCWGGNFHAYMIATREGAEALEEAEIAEREHLDVRAYSLAMDSRTRSPMLPLTLPDVLDGAEVRDRPAVTFRRQALELNCLFDRSPPTSARSCKSQLSQLYSTCSTSCSWWSHATSKTCMLKTPPASVGPDRGKTSRCWVAPSLAIGRPCWSSDEGSKFDVVPHLFDPLRAADGLSWAPADEDSWGGTRVSPRSL